MTSSLPFKLNLSDTLSQWRSETFWTKEVETVAWLKYFSTYGDKEIESLVDVGANIGLYSLYWLSLNSKAQVIACEPFIENFNLLQTNLEMNSMKGRATLVSSPLYLDSISGSFLLEDERPGSSGSQFQANTDSDKSVTENVDSTTIDEIVGENGKKMILKIDVDGLDFEILQGASRSLRTGLISSVLIEASEDIQLQISEFLAAFSYVSDSRFNELEAHSDVRRKAAGKLERNRVYTLSALV